MTTIIWIKEKNKLTIAWDYRTNHSWYYTDTTNKIYKFWNLLIWRSWDNISCKLFNEIYNSYILEHWIISCIRECINFFNYVKTNCNIYNSSNNWEPLIALMFLHKDFQIKIDWNWQTIEMKDDILSMWSWYDIVTTLKAVSKKISKLDLVDYFDTVSSLDLYTSKEFNTLEIEYEW